MWRIFSVGLESTTVTPLAGRTERRYADADVGHRGRLSFAKTSSDSLGTIQDPRATAPSRA